MFLISKDFIIIPKSELDLAFIYTLAPEPHVERNAGFKNFKEQIYENYPLYRN